ncbi:hypothetical protein V499_06299 [Pseudogymnoascus sp. VKM F-103]|nr:hypothetical protein V499_06299 [Pseudogymnoascus sp. VKM F-103]
MRPSPAMLHAKTKLYPPSKPSPSRPQGKRSSASPASPPLGLTLLLPNRMQHHLIRHLRTTPRVPLTPVITNRIRKHPAISAERRSGDTAARGGERTDPHVRVLIPEVECAVRARRAEGAVLRVEGDGVHGVGGGDVVRGRGAVAFECEVEAGWGC